MENCEDCLCQCRFDNVVTYTNGCRHYRCAECDAKYCAEREKAENVAVDVDRVLCELGGVA